MSFFCSEIPLLISLYCCFLLSHFPSYSLSFCSFSLVTLGAFEERPADLGSSPCRLCQSPSPLALFFFLLLQCYSRSRPHDEEQGTMGAFSGPLHGPLPLLYDLSPSLAYILVHRHASTKGRILV